MVINFSKLTFQFHFNTYKIRLNKNVNLIFTIFLNIKHTKNTNHDTFTGIFTFCKVNNTQYVYHKCIDYRKLFYVKKFKVMSFNKLWEIS